MDVGRIGALSRSIRDPTGDTKGTYCGHHSRAEWRMDETDRTESDRLRRGILSWLQAADTLFGGNR